VSATFPQPVGLSRLADAPYEGERLVAAIGEAGTAWRYRRTYNPSRLPRHARLLADVLDGLKGGTLQGRWETFEHEVWPRWRAGQERLDRRRWALGVAALAMGRAVRPGWPLLAPLPVTRWLAWLADDDPLVVAAGQLGDALAGLTWASEECRRAGVRTGVRIMLAGGLRSLGQITEQDLIGAPPRATSGLDALDAALCAAGVLDRSPRRGTARHGRSRRLSAAELVDQWEIPPRFCEVTALYLESYAARVSDVYSTLRLKRNALGHFWRYLDERHPEVERCADVLPAHAHGFIEYAIELGRRASRPQNPDPDRSRTAHAWLVNVRTFFRDLASWGTEPGSPLAPHVPRAVPLERHDLKQVGFEQARRRGEAQAAAAVLDLEREVPKIRAHALRRWQDADDLLEARPNDARAEAAERQAFWDWALLELLVQSGLRIEEACELTTLDVLKRRLPDGRLYYLLHVKPSKFDRARVIPLGDGLGQVIAQIIRHVRRFHGADAVPACDLRDHREKRDLPRAPYLLQAMRFPGPISMTRIRASLRRLAEAAGACTADGSPLRLRPHDCRRIFASEHLNNDTPVHVIQALLGHATLDTVMVYAKLYPTKLVEEYRKAMRGTYQAIHGPDALRNPSAAEWVGFTASCSLRDMGTHVCALPAGDHCPRGLVCLGCSHAQPKKSAAPVFRRMLHSHRKALGEARESGEPAGQVAARELEVERIEAALRRADELDDDVAAAIEAAA
jgi:integrase